VNWERQIMAALFVPNPKVGAGAAPFFPVRRNSATAGARLREKMGQFMTQRAVNLRFAVGSEMTIQEDPGGMIFRAPGRGTQPP
jgi:hypothetical protein